MQMPHLIHLVGRGDLMVRHQGQEDELPVLLDRAQAKRPAPAVGTDQMVEKADLMAGIIQFISADLLIELLLLLQHGTLFICCY